LNNSELNSTLHTLKKLEVNKELRLIGLKTIAVNSKNRKMMMMIYTIDI
jgi:hypothetical protein